MTTEHSWTPGMWIAKGDVVESDNGSRVAIMSAHDPEQARADAIHIVRCVDASAGLNPEAVKVLVIALEAVVKEVSIYDYPDDHSIADLLEAYAKLKA